MTDYKIDSYQASTQLMLSTVKADTVYTDGSGGSGTAFIYRHYASNEIFEDYLVTNRHVIENTLLTTFRFHSKPTGPKNSLYIADWEQISIAGNDSLWNFFPNDLVDICAINLQQLLDTASLKKADIFYYPIGNVPPRETLERMPAIMEVAMIGYPNGLWDEVNNMPIIRLGCTATHPAIDFNGNPESVVDISCFPGSSGSPVVFHNRSYFGNTHPFLGVLYAGPTMTSEGDVITEIAPTHTKTYAQMKSMLNLGYVIKGDVIQRFIAKIYQRSNNLPSTVNDS